MTNFGQLVSQALAPKPPKQRKLPFVWQINNKGVVSHAVGIAHAVPDVFQADINRLLFGKKKVLTEVTQPEASELKIYRERQARGAQETNFDPCHAIYGTALAMGIPVYGLEAEEEHEEYGKIIQQVDARLSNADRSTFNRVVEGLRRAYVNRDETTYQALNEQFFRINRKYSTTDEREKLTGRHPIMAERSLEHLEEPSLISVGLEHLQEDLSMLDVYRDKGIKVERVQ